MNRIKRLKILPPTLRAKKRYIKFKILSEYEIADLEESIWNTFLDFYGENEVGKFGLNLIKNLWDNKKKVGVIRCNHLYLNKVLAGLGLIQRLGDNRINFKIIKISGTIRKLG